MIENINYKKLENNNFWDWKTKPKTWYIRNLYLYMVKKEWITHLKAWELQNIF